jgi:hypothetical protein
MRALILLGFLIAVPAFAAEPQPPKEILSAIGIEACGSTPVIVIYLDGTHATYKSDEAPPELLAQIEALPHSHTLTATSPCSDGATDKTAHKKVSDCVAIVDYASRRYSQGEDDLFCADI